MARAHKTLNSCWIGNYFYMYTYTYTWCCLKCKRLYFKPDSSLTWLFFLWYIVSIVNVLNTYLGQACIK